MTALGGEEESWRESSLQLYNACVRSWDVAVVGAGIIGITLSIQLRRGGLRVLVVDRGEPGREASHAAAGMLADCALETPAALQPLATASARMYPEFVHQIEDESGMSVDLRPQGTLFFFSEELLHERPELAGQVRQNIVAWTPPSAMRWFRWIKSMGG